MPPKFWEALKEGTDPIRVAVGDVLGELRQFCLRIAKGPPEVPQGRAGVVGLEHANRSHMLFAIALIDVICYIISETGIKVDVNIRFLGSLQA
jgi:hypothetical protein